MVLRIALVNFMGQMRFPKHFGNAFTLIELLVVVAVIGILGGLLLPALVAGKEKARRVACRSNLRQMLIAVQLYADDHQQQIPPGPSNQGDYPPMVSTNTWRLFISYGGHKKIIGCPGLPTPFSVGGYSFPPYGYVLGFNYLGGRDPAVWAGVPAAKSWISPRKATESGLLPLLTDLNVWSPEPQSVASHGKYGVILEGGTDATNPNSGGKTSRELGAAGGNLGALDGSAVWRRIEQMREYQLSTNANELRGLW